ncbi:MAG: hypothetical protein ACFCA4_18755 [Cyanophyceae cyanobacterium]
MTSVVAHFPPTTTAPATLSIKQKVVDLLRQGNAHVMAPTRDMRRMGIDLWGIYPSGNNFTLDLRIDREAYATGNGFIRLSAGGEAGDRQHWQRICAADLIAYVVPSPDPDEYDVLFLFEPRDLGQKLVEWAGKYPLRSMPRRKFALAKQNPRTGGTVKGLVVPLEEIHHISKEFLL